MAAISTGLMTSKIRTINCAEPILEKEMGPVNITGLITDLEKLPEGKGHRFILSNPNIEDLSPEKTPLKIRLRTYKGENIRVGDKVSVLAGINPPSAPVIPGSFDFQRYAYFKRIGAFGFTYNEPQIIEHHENIGIHGILVRTRQNVINKIEQYVQDPEASFVIALMTGERSSISEDDWEAMRDAGLAHMLAISGLHVGLITAIIFFISRFIMAMFSSFALNNPIKKYAAFIALLGALSYTLMVGAPVSTQRAMMMAAVVLIAVMLDRTAISLRIVSIAATVILVITPDALFGAGFQMSFAAVTMLILFYEFVRPFWTKFSEQPALIRKISLYLLGACFTTLVATIAVAPFSLYHFQQIDNYGILANLLAGPLMAFLVMPAAVLSYITMLIGVEEYALIVMGQAVKLIISIAYDVSNLPLSTFNPPAWPFSAFLCFVFSGLLLIIWNGKGKLVAIVPFIIAFLIILQFKQPDIIISSSGDLIAISDDKESLFISSKSNDRFSAEIWARQLGIEEGRYRKWPTEGTDNGDTGLMCDENGCRIVMNNKNIAISFLSSSHQEDCEWADIIISQKPLFYKPCKGRIIIDKFQLWSEGAHTIHFENNEVIVTTVSDLRGSRPWTVSNNR
jgi:competence protein ComEC